MKKTLFYDLHLHTSYSDGRSPYDQVINAAISNGLDCIALTDHIFPDSNLDWMDTLRQDVEQYQKDILVLIGGECTVLNPEGDITATEEMRSKLDILLVDFGWRTERVFKDCSSKEEVLNNVEKAMLLLCDNSLLDVMAHPFNLGRNEIPITPGEVPDEMLHRIAEKFAQTGMIFEIMNTMPIWFPDIPVQQTTSEYLHIVKVFKEHKVKFSIGSDAHSCCGVGNLKWSEKIIANAGIEDSIIDPRQFKNK